MKKRWRIGTVSLLGLGALSVASAQTVYVLGRPSGPTTITRFGTLNLSTGAYSKIADLSIGLSGLASGADGTLYGIGGGFEQFLYKVSSTGVVTLVGDTGRSLANGSNSGFGAAEDGTLYMRQGGDIFSLNSLTGIAALVGNMGVAASGQFAGDASGKLYTFVQGLSAGLYQVNRATGAATYIGGFSYYDTLVNVGGTMYTTTRGFGLPSTYTVSTVNGSSQPLASYDSSAAGVVYAAARTTSPAPEPGTFAALGLGALTLVRRSRMRRRRF